MDEDDGGTRCKVKVKDAADMAAKFEFLGGPFSEKELTILVNKFEKVQELEGVFEQFQETCKLELMTLLKPIKEPEEDEGPEKDEGLDEEPELSTKDLLRVQEIRERFTPGDLLRLQKKYPAESDQQAALLYLVLVLEKKRQKLFQADMCESDPGADDTDDDSDVDEEDDDDDHTCCECGKGDDEASMLLCDRCNDAFHMKCLNPPLDEVPDGDWFCPNCIVKAPDVVTAQTDILMKIDQLYKEEEPVLELKAAALALDKEKKNVLVKVQKCQKEWVPELPVNDGKFKTKYWSLFPPENWLQDVRDAVKAREPEGNVPFQTLCLELRKEYDAVKTKVRALEQEYAKKIPSNPWFTDPVGQKTKLAELYYSLHDAGKCEKREEEDRQTAYARKKEDQKTAELRAKEMLELEKERKGKEPDTVGCDDEGTVEEGGLFHICNRGVWCNICKLPNDWPEPDWMQVKKQRRA